MHFVGTVVAKHENAREYQWFWRVDGPENAKITKFGENAKSCPLGAPGRKHSLRTSFLLGKW